MRWKVVFCNPKLDINVRANKRKTSRLKILVFIGWPVIVPIHPRTLLRTRIIVNLLAIAGVHE